MVIATRLRSGERKSLEHRPLWVQTPPRPTRQCKLRASFQIYPAQEQPAAAVLRDRAARIALACFHFQIVHFSPLGFREAADQHQPYRPEPNDSRYCTASAFPGLDGVRGGNRSFHDDDFESGVAGTRG